MPQRVSKSVEDLLSYSIIGCAIETHRVLGGPGLLESIYEEALAWELSQAGHQVERQLSLPVHYKSIQMSAPLRIDLLVDKKVIVECKSAEKTIPLFKAQLLTYLRLSGLKLGLVINFGEINVKEGIHRVINGYLE